MSRTKRRAYGEGSVSQRKDGLWVGRLRLGKKDDGKPNIKVVYGKSRQEALVKLDELKDSLNIEKPTTVSDFETVRELMLRWLFQNKKNEIKPSSFSRLEQTVHNQVLPVLGAYPVDDVTPQDVQKLLNDLFENGLSYSTIKKTYEAIRACYDKAVLQHSAICNPAIGVSLPSKKKFPQQQIRYYTKEESLALRQAARACYRSGKPKHRLGDGIVLDLHTGLRCAELLGLQWEDVDFEKCELTVCRSVVRVRNHSGKGSNWIMVLQDDTKSEAGRRTIPLNKTAMEALQHLYQITGQSQFVLSTANGIFLSQRNLDRMFRAICRDAGLPEEKIYGLHALRHTFATMLFELKVDIKEISTILGHSTVRVTYDTYVHPSHQSKKECVDVLDAYFEG